ALIAVSGSLADSSGSRRTLTVQSAMPDSSRGGNVYGRVTGLISMAEMALRSPDRLPLDSRRSSVLPPRKKNRPVNIRACGAACRKRATVVIAALRFDASISREIGKYFVVPLVVPDESA